MSNIRKVMSVPLHDSDQGSSQSPSEDHSRGASITFSSSELTLSMLAASRSKATGCVTDFLDVDKELLEALLKKSPNRGSVEKVRALLKKSGGQ